VFGKKDGKLHELHAHATANSYMMTSLTIRSGDRLFADTQGTCHQKLIGDNP
jgi:hypothetical protein